MADVKRPVVTVETLRRVMAKMAERKRQGTFAPKVVYILGEPVHIGMKLTAEDWNSAWKRVNERNSRKTV